MRYLQAGRIEEGMIAALPVFDNEGRVLVAENSVFTATIIANIKRQGYPGAYIQDEWSSGIEVKPLIPASLHTKGIACIAAMDIDGCRDVSKQIVDEILKNDIQTLDMMSLRSFDGYTHAHSLNVGAICGIMAFGMGFSEPDTIDLITAALLHDIGKTKIPPGIIGKPGRLTPEEYEIIKTHAMLSYEMVKDKWGLSSVAKSAILFHHENEDGSGYPHGLKGVLIPHFAKIIHVVDVFDALTAKRSYRNPSAPMEAIEYLMGGCGVMFDREVVQALMKYVPFYPKGTEVKLNDGRVGIVYENRMYILPPEGSDSKENLKLEEERKKMIGEESSHSESKDDCSSGRRHKILAVDDTKIYIKTLDHILGDEYDISFATTGNDALRFLESNERVDLVLMDIEMPGMSGIETTDLIRQKYGDALPVMYVTAQADRETVLTCHRQGVSGYIVKPFKPEVIKAQIRKVLHR